MKRKKMLVATVIAVLPSIVYAQYPLPWNNNTTNGVKTFTEENVGVGVFAQPTDAKLTSVGAYLYNPVLSVNTPALTELKLNRRLYKSLGSGPTSQANIMEASYSIYDYNDYGDPLASSSSTTTGFVLTQGFKLGLGTPNPVDRLTVEGNIGFPASTLERNIFGRSNGGFNIVANTDYSDGSLVRLFGSDPTTNDFPGGIQFMSNIGTSNGVAMEWANYDGANWTSMLNLLGSGNFGIGTFPVDKLTVKGDISLYYPADDKERNIFARTDKETLNIAANTNTSNGPVIQLLGNTNSVRPGAITFYTNGAPNNATAFNFMRDIGGGYYTDLMRISKEGKVFIGGAPLPDPNNNPYDYKLYVKNGILTERVKVALTTTNQWSDFVFDDDYKLMPLSEVESYIEANNHLPEIPSTKEVLKDGLDLAAMDAKLLQKVEELTLYVIQQQKEIEKLKGEIKNGRK